MSVSAVGRQDLAQQTLFVPPPRDAAMSVKELAQQRSPEAETPLAIPSEGQGVKIDFQV